jgi:hypothetical protein
MQTGDLKIVGFRQDQNQRSEVLPSSVGKIPEGATILALGSRAAHDTFAERYGSLQARGGH